MKEKLETLTIIQLRDLAKHEGLKHISSLKKHELVEALDIHYSEKEKTEVSSFNSEDSGTVTERESNIGTAFNSGNTSSTTQAAYKTENDKRKLRDKAEDKVPMDMKELDSGISAHGILEVMPDGFGFIRCDNFLPGDDDVYVAPSQIKRFRLKTGDIISGSRRVKTPAEKFAALLYVQTVNGFRVSEIYNRANFEDLTPIFPNKRIPLSNSPSAPMSMRVVDLISPIGKGQRGMIVSPPKAGKTTLLKEIAKAVLKNEPDMHLIILLIDEKTRGSY